MNTERGLAPLYDKLSVLKDAANVSFTKGKGNLKTYSLIWAQSIFLTGTSLTTMVGAQFKY